MAKRFNPAVYDPAADSSKGHEKVRTAEKLGTDSVVLIVGEGECPDGCGGKPNSTRRTFRQGHDARLKGICIRAAATDTSIHVVRPDKIDIFEPAALGSEFGFGEAVAAGGKLHKDRLAAQEKKAAEREAKKAEKAATKPKTAPGTRSTSLKGQRFPIKIGRWTYEAEVVKVVKGVATLKYENKKGEQTIERPVGELQA